MGINLAAIMDAIEANLVAAYPDMRVFPYPALSVPVPATIVGYPETVLFDLTYNRGADRATFPVWVVVGVLDSLSARDALSDYLSKDGVLEIKAALDGQLPVSGVPTVQDANVIDAAPAEYVMNNTQYLSAKFSLDVVA